MFGFRALGALSAFGIVPLVAAVASQSYTWKNVKIGGGGGFIPGIVFNPSQKVCELLEKSFVPSDDITRGLRTPEQILVAHTN
jgi:hypothetical protein